MLYMPFDWDTSSIVQNACKLLINQSIEISVVFVAAHVNLSACEFEEEIAIVECINCAMRLNFMAQKLCGNHAFVDDVNKRLK